MEVTDIENVPHSPTAGYDPTDVYNPLDEDFTHPQGGVDYTIPAKSKATFPKFRAHHLAKHLAMKIVHSKFYSEIQAEVYNPLNPNSDKWKTVIKSIPNKRITDVMIWLLEPKGACPEDSIKGVSTEEIDEAVKERVEGTLKSEKEKYEDLSWGQLKKVAAEKGLWNPKMTKKEVLEKLNS